jgi:hypothetical protein
VGGVLPQAHGCMQQVQHEECVAALQLQLRPTVQLGPSKGGVTVQAAGKRKSASTNAWTPPEKKPAH